MLYFFPLKLKIDPHHLDVENLDFGIDESNEFNHFEDDALDLMQSQISQTEIGSSTFSMSLFIYNQH